MTSSQFTEENPSTLEVSSEAASLVLVSQNDDAIDLTLIKSGARPIAKAIHNGFLSTMRPMLDSISVDDDLKSLFAFLMERIARLESDNFILKTALVNSNRFVLGDVARYSDPIVAMHAYASSGSEAPLPQMHLTRIPLGPNVLGQGWYEVEMRGETNYWRWSGPGNRATLLLPSPGNGKKIIYFDFQVVDRSIMRDFVVSINGNSIEQAKIDWNDALGGRMIVEVDVGNEDLSSFIFFELRLNGTLPLPLVDGNEDSRRVGIGIGEIIIERSDNG